MGLLDDAAEAVTGDGDATDTRQADPAMSYTLTREATTYADGEEVTIEDPETTQTDDTGTWLTGTNAYGRPRNIEALEMRQIVQTSAMQAIVNGIASNIVGGELTKRGREDVQGQLSDAEQQAADDLWLTVRDVLQGPHLADESLDDLVVAVVEDMLGPGEGIIQMLQPADGAGVDLPVVALSTLDPLTIRKNVNQNGVFQEPKYFQANQAFGGQGVAALGSVDPVELGDDDIAVLSYPLGNRSYKGPYPISPAWQVREWLEVLANSTTHHNNFYADDRIPAGILSFTTQASGTSIQDIREKIQAAQGDPRSAPVVEGSGQWIDMGGTAVNLNVIEEQRWFFFLCLGSLGLGKQEMGFIEDVNRSNGEVESSRIFKRVVGPFVNQFEQAFRKVADQFDAYRELGRPWVPTISYSDPREEHAKEQRLREQYQAGVVTLEQYRERSPQNEPLAGDGDDTTIEVGGEVIDYAAHPWPVVQRLISAAAGDVPVDVDTPLDAGEGESGDTGDITYATEQDW